MRGPHVPLLAMLVFAGISTDVNSHVSLHLAQPLDMAVHNTVVGHVSPEVRRVVGKWIVSDTPLVLGTLVWLWASWKMVRRDLPSGLLTMAFSGLALAQVAGILNNTEPYVTYFLKNIYCRLRPDGTTASFSFPSGHAAAASFIMGTTFFLLLPRAYLPRKNLPAPDTTTPLDRALAALPANPTSHFAVYASLTATTCLGRLIGDRHWLTDVSAGWMVGLTVACLTMGLEFYAQEKLADLRVEQGAGRGAGEEAAGKVKVKATEGAE